MILPENDCPNELLQPSKSIVRRETKADNIAAAASARMPGTPTGAGEPTEGRRQFAMIS